MKLITRQNREMMQPAREDVNVFHRKYDVIHVSAQRRRHFQINSNQEVTLCAKTTCFIRGWVEHTVFRLQRTRPEGPYRSER